MCFVKEQTQGEGGNAPLDPNQNKIPFPINFLKILIDFSLLENFFNCVKIEDFILILMYRLDIER